MRAGEINHEGEVTLQDQSVAPTGAANQVTLYSSSGEFKFKAGDDNVIGYDGTEGIPFTFDGAGAAISTGAKGFLEIPFDCVIIGIKLMSDVSTNTVVDIWKDTYANFPPTDADSITASATPTLTAATKYSDTTLTGWTTTITAGDWIRFNIDSNSAATWLTIQLTVRRT